MNKPFPVDPVYSGISLAYKNTSYIADLVLPRVKVGKSLFKYRKFDKGQYLTIPDTLVGRKGIPNQIELGCTEQEASVISHALDQVVPLEDIADAPEGYDPQKKAVEFLTEMILLDRECRTANLVFSEGTYANGCKRTLTGDDQFSSANSNPINVIKTALDSCWMRPNVMVLGREVFSVLSVHPSIVQALYPTSGGNGIVTAQQIADLFDVEQVLVGNTWVNGAKRGATPVLQRAWGKHMAMLYINPSANTNDMPTFGVTAELGSRFSGSIAQPEVGIGGANLIRVGERVKELIIANDLGYFIKNAIA